jgi:hypothetical protein
MVVSISIALLLIGISVTFLEHIVNKQSTAKLATAFKAVAISITQDFANCVFAVPPVTNNQ